MKSKKAVLGGETVMWIYRFLLIGIMLIGFIAVVSNFYSAKYYIRPAESVLLARRVMNCIAANGIIEIEAFDSAKVTECTGLSKDEINEIYIDALLNYSDSSSFAIGDSTLKVLCGSKGKYMPSCLNQKYYLLLKRNGNLERARLDLLIAIKKLEKNV